MHNSAKIIRAVSRVRPSLSEHARFFSSSTGSAGDGPGVSKSSGTKGASKKNGSKKAKHKQQQDGDVSTEQAPPRRIKRSKSQEMALARSRFGELKDSVDADFDKVTIGLADRLQSLLGRDTVDEITTLAKDNTRSHSRDSFKSDPQAYALALAWLKKSLTEFGTKHW